MRYGWALALLGAVIACGGCGGSSGTAAAADMAAPVGKLCTDARADGWTLPIVKTSEQGLFKVTLMSSRQPIPVIGDNMTTWTLQVQDASGAMVSGATLTATPYMPDHHHGTTILAGVTPAATSGQYTVEPLYFFMAGLWQITFDITSGAGHDKVVYSLCLTDA